MSNSGGTKNRKMLTSKAAEKLFDGLRDQQPQAFRGVKSILVGWQRSNNQSECYAKMQELLVSYPDFTKAINEYIEEQGRFAVHNTFNHKVEELFKYLRTYHTDYLAKVLQTLNSVMKESEGQPQDARSEEKVKLRFLQIFKDNQEIYNRAKNILDDAQFTQKPKEQEVKRQVTTNLYEDQDSRKQQTKQKPEKKKVVMLPPQEPALRNKSQQIMNTGINPEEMMLMLRLEKKSPSYVKILRLYEMCILTKAEVIAMMPDMDFEGQEESEMFRDLVELRELERRKTQNLFKPLNDLDFTNSPRATPSYVEMPWSYPINCSHKTQEMKGLLNDKWVSVPYGSEHYTFCIRQKNQYEIQLIKSEDERYQFDLYTYRMKKACQMLQKVINEPQMSDQEAIGLISSVISMGLVQTIYKNAQKDQKEQLEVNMRVNRVDACYIIRQRMLDQLSALATIRQVHGQKTWHEISQKNYNKSLDIKCSELKKNEKDFTKQSYFQTEMEERMKQLKNKQYKPRYFDENTSIWRVLNTFEGISITEKCFSHSSLPIREFDKNFTKNKQLLPLIFLSFGDDDCRQALYSFLIYHVNSMIPGESERNRVKKCAAKIMQGFLRTKLKEMSLKEGLNDEVIEGELTALLAVREDIPLNHYHEQLSQGSWDKQDSKPLPMDIELDDLKESRICIKKEQNDELGYLPIKDDNDSILYMTLPLYTVLRTIYTLYQRLLRAKEILYDYKNTKNLKNPLGAYKFQLFKQLLMQYIKAKESSKYEDFLEKLFGKDSWYLFSTMHKLVQSLTKSIQSCLQCQFTGKLLDLGLISEMKPLVENEYLYLMLVSKMSINSTNGDKLIRAHLNGSTMILSINCLKSCYKGSLEEGKDKVFSSKVQEIQKSVQLYLTITYPHNEPINGSGKSPKKKEKRTDFIEANNGLQLMCIDQTLKLYSIRDQQDFLFYNGRRNPLNKAWRKELKRQAKFQEFILARLK